VSDAGDRYKDMVMGQGATLKQGDRIDIRYTHAMSYHSSFTYACLATRASPCVVC
jgi:hypothetical protein